MELGVPNSAHYIEVAEKYKKDCHAWEKEIERLNKELEDKNIKIINKEQEIKKYASPEGGPLEIKQHNELIIKISKL